MNNSNAEDNQIYKVVVNDEEQYSIWRANYETPTGWTDTGKKGTKAECLAYIESVWVDMTPKSLRVKSPTSELPHERLN